MINYRGMMNTNNPIVDFYGAKLFTRQAQVAELVSEALSNKEIAVKLKITEKTVKFHLTNIFRNTFFDENGINNRQKLIRHVATY